ncbi:hypothetical protein BS50DRAFT_656565 [Corynespora cassiicola Philippines]|uniref:ferric-chelate reductase (NADPH) n=1 Tax=Corynespora cassiicola Philippines TaxID=1448308 RepID=A0A2T2N4H1_CORCC|nr:hypothetical protein BS50DRAFT_656565 [Corynespora cassiicola Philippines]
MDVSWLTYPLAFTGMRMFECDDLSTKECDWYKQRWHFWYIADFAFAVPTVAFFVCTIGVFIIGHCISTILLHNCRLKNSKALSKPIALVRYLSYRGFHFQMLGWNCAPVGILLLGAIGTIFFFCMVLAPKPYYWADEKFGGSPPLATRSGWLALGCMPFVFATASKTNWITLVTGVSYERLQVFHRWISYAFFVLALLHTFPFIVYHIHWHDMESHFSESLLFYWTGVVALVAQALLTFLSHSTIRRFGYEFFKMTHFAATIVFMVTFFWHCDYTLTSWHYFVATAAVYVPCFVFPWLRTIFEYKWTQKAHVTVEENGFTRVTIPADFNWMPGQHCFLRFTSFGIQAFSSHPFTICSSSSSRAGGKSELVFFIRHQLGFTKTLYQRALHHPGISVPVLVDGPYGGVSRERLGASQHQLLIAGGSGAGWCLSFIEHFVTSLPEHPDEEDAIEGRHEKESSANHVRVVLATADASSRIWFERAVDEVLRRCGTTRSSSNTRVQVHLTGGAAKNAHTSDEATYAPHVSISQASGDHVVHTDKAIDTSTPAKEIEGRPRLLTIVQEEATLAAETDSSLGVYVCGPLAMQDDVRNAVAAENMKIITGVRLRSVYLYTEHFSWA